MHWTSFRALGAAFLAIVASNSVATMLARKANGRGGRVVVEGPPLAGTTRRPVERFDCKLGEPLYGPRDAVDLEKLRSSGLPFWLAGGIGCRRLRPAKAAGAAGIQVGTFFAYTRSGGPVDPTVGDREHVSRGEARRAHRSLPRPWVIRLGWSAGPPNLQQDSPRARDLGGFVYAYAARTDDRLSVPGRAADEPPKAAK